MKHLADALSDIPSPAFGEAKVYTEKGRGMGEMPELLPCPFCGGSAEHFYRHEPSGFSNTDWVCCVEEDCGCGTCLHETKDLAIEAWNRRPHLSPPDIKMGPSS